MTQTDPGVGGKKLSKSDSDDKLEARNKSYGKVLDLQIKYIRAFQGGLFDEVESAKFRWLQKSEWHEKEFGW
jgi:hypothetical protein